MANQDGLLYKLGWSGLTYSNIQAFNGKTIPSASQSSVNNLIKALEGFICRSTGRQFSVLSGSDNYYEIFTSGKKKYQLKGFPIELKKITVNSVVVYDSSTPLTGQYILNTDFYVKNNAVIFPSGLDASGYYNDVEIQYQIKKFWEEDLTEAMIRIVSDIYLNKAYSGKSLSSFSFSGMSLNFKDEGLTKTFEDLIAYYKVDIL